MRCRVLDLFSATLPQIFNPAVYRQGDPVHFHLEKAGAQAQGEAPAAAAEPPTTFSFVPAEAVLCVAPGNEPRINLVMEDTTVSSKGKVQVSACSNMPST